MHSGGAATSLFSPFVIKVESVGKKPLKEKKSTTGYHFNKDKAVHKYKYM